ncbi:MAG: phage tail protein [Sedimenticola selenatireducens]|uniref:Phage tail protein n=2 Tax=Sedimenticola selenatireducens TaxID=191960 RepID=A0A2N6CT14_9GAMM|nr:MAG: phage tail protein [Sedimenticola selenatireducens]
MPEYLSPGVYVEEIQSGPRPIQGVGTSTAGFVGQTERGPMTPRLVTSWGDYSRWFGDVIDPPVSFLPFSLRGFFENGGLRAFVARVTGAGPVTSASNLATQDAAGNPIANNVLRIRAIGPGAWGNNIMIWVRNATQADINTLPPRDWFRITVLYYRDGIPVPFIDPTNPANLAHPQRREPTVLEDFDNLTAVAGRSNYVLNVINNNSYLIEADFFDTNTNLPGIAARPSNVGGASSSATVDLATADANTSLRVQAVGPGTWANTLTVDVAIGTNANTFQITVNDGANAVENYDNIPDADPGQAISLVNGTSARIRLSWAQVNPPNATVPSRPNDVAAAALAGGANTGMLNGTNGAAISPNDYAGSAAVPPNQRTGLAAIEIIDEVALLIAPDEVNGSIVNNFQITSELVNQCERLRDRFAVLSIPANQGNVQNILKPRDTSYAAAYYPWVRVFDSRTQDTRLVPPAGHVAGIFARSDQQRGVHKAPANEVIRDIVNRDLSPTIRPLEFHLGRGEHDILNPRGINVIRDFRSDGRGIRVYGARTLSSDPLWTYVNVRRLFLYVEESIDEGTQWVVFEPNDYATWARVRQVVSNFLTLVWRSGALFGARAEDAFFVRCGPDTMTPADIDTGRLICEVGIAPVKPAEFVIFRIQQKTVELAA